MKYTVILCFVDDGNGGPGMFMTAADGVTPDHAVQLALGEAIEGDWHREDLVDHIVIEGDHNDCRSNL